MRFVSRAHHSDSELHWRFSKRTLEMSPAVSRCRNYLRRICMNFQLESQRIINRVKGHLHVAKHGIVRGGSRELWSRCLLFEYGFKCLRFLSLHELLAVLNSHSISLKAVF